MNLRSYITGLLGFTWYLGSWLTAVTLIKLVLTSFASLIGSRGLSWLGSYPANVLNTGLTLSSVMFLSLNMGSVFFFWCSNLVNSWDSWLSWLVVAIGTTSPWEGFTVSFRSLSLSNFDCRVQTMDEWALSSRAPRRHNPDFFLGLYYFWILAVVGKPRCG